LTIQLASTSWSVGVNSPPTVLKSLDIIYVMSSKTIIQADGYGDKGRGVCGDVAPAKEKSSHADISEPERPVFGRPPDQLKKTEHVTSAISVKKQ